LKGLLTLTKMLFRNWLRSRTGAFFSFMFPVMLLLVFGTVFGGQNQVTFTLHVQNLDLQPDGNPTELSQAFIKALNSSLLVVKPLSVEVGAEEFIKKQSSSFENTRVLVIDKGFEEALLSNGVAARLGVTLDTMKQALTRFGSSMNATQREALERGIKQLELALERITLKPLQIRLLTSPSDRNSPTLHGILDNFATKFSNEVIGASTLVSVVGEKVETRELRPVDYYLPGYIAAFIMTNGVIGVSTTVSEYRRRKVLKRLVATPLSKFTWILGNIVTQTVLALLLTVLMVAIGWLVFGIRVIPDAFSLALICLGAVTFCGLGVLLAGLLKDVEAVSALSNAIAFPMMFLAGSFWPLEIMPAFMQQIARALPLYYFQTGLRQTLVLQAPAAALGSVTILGVLAIAFVLGGSLLTKWKDL